MDQVQLILVYVFVIRLANVNLTQFDQNDLPRILLKHIQTELILLAWPFTWEPKFKPVCRIAHKYENLKCLLVFPNTPTRRRKMDQLQVELNPYLA